MRGKLYGIIVAGILVWALVASSLTAYYWLEYSKYKRLYESLSVKVIVVNIGVDYGNGTVAWYNKTVLPAGSTVLSALVQVAKVEYKVFPYGAYVVSVNGVSERMLSKNEGYSWIWYIYDKKKGKMTIGPTAADKYQLSNNDIVLWRYQHWSYP
ncbi:MAG: hypothetical protein DRJ52_02330 [Thermoprotei archaeon]|nr:MAG: hypothetical protein DRJ52_02330 [Thermoprotei archaeon]RLE99993.1 MAG: hypothetical protein DRJ63_03740 [Thermoprotei archaeon]HDI74663.1 DUF4430 domain-containing protein [Thermoprotei archaeon]